MMDTLSDEVLLLIFNNLNLRDILTCSLVNKQFYRIVYDEELWKNIGQVDFGQCYHKLYLNNNYHQTYKLCYDLTKLKTILELKEMISDFYHWNNILLNEKHQYTQFCRSYRNKALTGATVSYLKVQSLSILI